MNIKFFDRNISAVSLIEIMMIFTIIGVVTTACVSLAKPKYEYMKKIKLFSTLDMLENAAKIIQQEGSIDYTTDVNTCTSGNRNSSNNNRCDDYTNKYPHLNNQLPKLSVARNSTDVKGYTMYRHLGATEKNQFEYLQKGLCERLQKVFAAELSTKSKTQISCAANDLIDDAQDKISTVAGSGYFRNKKPQLILPNGQAVFISKHLYTDYGTTRYIVYATKQESGYTYNYEVANSDEKLNLAIGMLNNKNNYTVQPNETRIAAAEAAQVANKSSANILKELFLRNKDYYVIYVDINCQMHNGNSSDKMCSSDTLNDDVFAFRMYRDGTVIPDTSFPSNLLTARILFQDKNDMNGKYTLNPSGFALIYSNLPINKARCYANLMCNGHNNNDICSICKNYAQVTAHLPECSNGSGESVCKVIINKPSFIMR